MQRLNSALIIIVILATSPALAARKYLYQWDEGSGTTMPGWTYHDDLKYGHPGWLLDVDGPFGGLYTDGSQQGAECFEIAAYDSNNLAEIVTNDRAPSTSTAGAFKVYENPATLDTATHLTSWWVWRDAQQLGRRGITDANTDRWSFYIKTTGTPTASQSNSGATFHVGTYLTDQVAYTAYGTGDGAPYEGPGNQHYYHYLRLSPGAWLHVELDRHPTHLRGDYVPGNDPSYISPATDNEGTVHYMHYYEHLSQFYMEIRDENISTETSMTIDEMYFYSTQDPTESAEPNQNDESITSVWVGYWPDTGKWQMGWNDMSYIDETGAHLSDYTNSTFEIRWSTAPITNANFSSALLLNLNGLVTLSIRHM